MIRAHDINAKRILFNTGINLSAEFILAITAFACTPFIIKAFGVERFGILSITLLVLTYFRLFDLGLGAATTRFVAKLVGEKREKDIPAVIWTSVWTQLILGSIGGFILFYCSSFAAGFFRVSDGMRSDLQLMFKLVSFSLPFVIATGSLRGAMEAVQRFDLTNVLVVVSGALIFLIPAVAGNVGVSFGDVVLWIVISKILTAVLFFALNVYVFPDVIRSVRWDLSQFRAMAVFGGWVSVSSMVIPWIVSIDRFFLGMLTSVQALGYYSPPADIAARTKVIPVSLKKTVFPAFSAAGVFDGEKLSKMLVMSLKFTFIVMSPIVLVLITFSGDILSLWLGKDFAVHGTRVLQVLALGMLMNGLAQMSTVLLDGIGRPDMRAKPFLIYGPPYIVIAFFLIKFFGITGAALSWTFRAIVEFLVFTSISLGRIKRGWAIFRTEKMIDAGILFVAAMGLCLSISHVFSRLPWVAVVLNVICICAYAVIFCVSILNRGEKEIIMSVIRAKVGRYKADGNSMVKTGGKCPICDSAQYVTHAHFLYRKCAQCESLYQHSGIEKVPDYYSTHPVNCSRWKASYDGYMRTAGRYIDFKKKKAIIDVGAGDGTFLETCKALFGPKSLYAVEISPMAVKVLTEKGVKNISINELRTIEDKIVTVFQVIEHVEDPHCFISSLGLKEGDHLIMTSPAVDSPYCRFYGKKWKSLKPSHHVVMYSRKSLEHLCGKIGLRILFFGPCVSGSNGMVDAVVKYIWAVVKFPIKVILKRSSGFPLFHGKNSFLAIMVKV